MVIEYAETAAAAHEELEAGAAKSSTPTVPVMIARRYELLDRLGRGGFGEVWRAHDHVAREDVAVKLMDRARIAHPLRVRREIAALRRLRVPGVVRLLDEGIEGSWFFLVMEVAPGAAFPGPGVAGFADVLFRASRVLEALGRVHAHGLIHRDLKPANILVDDRGRATLLDFGVALASTDARITSNFDVVGTPAYLAPEQVSGEALGPRADLYAVGVMLFEALTGGLPFDVEGARAQCFARLFHRPRRLRAVVPELPQWLDDLVDQLLARDPLHRPRSAVDVVSRLRGAGALDAQTELPWIGRAAELALVERLLGERRAVAIAGPHGSGRTRFLRTLEARLRSAGAAVLRLDGGGGAFEPLRTLVDVASLGDLPLQEIRARYVSALTERLRDGVVVLIDDFDALDRSTASIVERCLSLGSIALTTRGAAVIDGAEDVRLAPLDATALRSLFGGPERFLHLPSDGAALLAARSEGLPSAVVAELEAWYADGHATWDGATVSIDRDSLERLRPGNIAAASRGLLATRARSSLPPLTTTPSDLPPMLEVVIDGLSLISGPTDGAFLGAVLGLPCWRVEAAIEELTARGLVYSLGGQHLITSAAAAWVPPGSPRAIRRAALHASIVALLPPSDERRVHHFLSAHGAVLPAEVVGAFVDELLAVAAMLSEAGRVERARVFLRDGAAVLRASSELAEQDGAVTLVAPHLVRLMRAWVPLALTDLVPRPMDAVLHELTRIEGEAGWGPDVGAEAARMGALVRAALTVLQSPQRALSMATDLAPFEEVGLELARHSVRVRAARAVAADTESDVIRSVAEWSATKGDARSKALLLTWTAMQHYRHGRFIDAAECSQRAASLAPDVVTRLTATTDAAASWMEAFRLHEAVDSAREALALATESRQSYFEALATWIARTSAYRGEEPLVCDPGVVDDVALLGVAHLEALMALTEAAIALRAGDRATCRALAGRVRARWQGVERSDFANLGAAMEVYAGDEIGPEAIGAMIAWARGCPVPGIGVQVLALLRPAWPPGWMPDEESVERLSRQVPEECWTRRIDVLSVAEARALIAGAAVTIEVRGT